MLSSQLVQVWLFHLSVICLTSPPLRPLPNSDQMSRLVPLLTLCCSAFIPGFHFPPVSLSLALSLQGTVLLPFRGQSSLHCWRQVAKDTSTQRQSLNIIRWERWAESGERGSSSGRIWSVGSQTTPLCSTENTKHPLLLATWSVPMVDGVWSHWLFVQRSIHLFLARRCFRCGFHVECCCTFVRQCLERGPPICTCIH